MRATERRLRELVGDVDALEPPGGASSVVTAVRWFRPWNRAQRLQFRLAGGEWVDVPKVIEPDPAGD